MNASPLGKYADIAATIVAISIVIAWLAIHGILTVSEALGVHIQGNIDTSAIDNATILTVGVVLGQRSTTNGAAKIALAAHARLDAINAPSAEAANTPVSPPNVPNI